MHYYTFTTLADEYLPLPTEHVCCSLNVMVKIYRSVSVTLGIWESTVKMRQIGIRLEEEKRKQ